MVFHVFKLQKVETIYYIVVCSVLKTFFSVLKSVVMFWWFVVFLCFFFFFLQISNTLSVMVATKISKVTLHFIGI